MARTTLPRQFEPYMFMNPNTPPISSEQIITYNAERGISQLQMPPPYRNERTVVMRIYGACMYSGTPAARASYSVFLGRFSRYNKSALLPASVSQTHTRAEMEALHHALNVVETISRDNGRLNRFVIGVSSGFLTEIMRDGIGNLLMGFSNTGKFQDTADIGMLAGLSIRLEAMQPGDDGAATEVQVWPLERALNLSAEIMAKDLLLQRLASRP